MERNREMKIMFGVMAFVLSFAIYAHIVGVNRENRANQVCEISAQGYLDLADGYSYQMVAEKLGCEGHKTAESQGAGQTFTGYNWPDGVVVMFSNDRLISRSKYTF
jgi:hypothetical protein